jgi:hypothetical protein
MSLWLVRVVPLLALLYALWWLAGIEQSVLAAIKVVMESIGPQVFSTVQSVAHSIEGGWKITTTIRLVDDQSAVAVLTVAPVFIKKSVIWIPAALALVLGSTPKKKTKSVGLALLLCGCASVTLALICFAAHLAVVINGTAAMLDDDVLPLPPDFPLNVSPYPLWYFHLVTFAAYLGALIAPLAMPAIIWVVTCHKEIRAMISTPKRPVFC